jgi:hypothetical protein
MSDVTRAETQARAMAKRLEDIGYEVRITAEPRPAAYYSHGGVMLQASVFVSVSATAPERWDHSYGYSFISYLPAEGHRASTSFAGGHVYRPLMPSRRASKKAGLREMRRLIAGEVENARYRAEHAAKES